MTVVTTNGFDYFAQADLDYSGVNNTSPISITMPTLPAGTSASYELDLFLTLYKTSYTSGYVELDAEDASGNNLYKNYFLLKRAETAVTSSTTTLDNASYNSTTGGVTSDARVISPYFGSSSTSDTHYIQMRITNDDTAPSLIMFETYGKEGSFGLAFNYGSIRMQGASGFTHIRTIKLVIGQARWGLIGYSIASLKGS